MGLFVTRCRAFIAPPPVMTAFFGVSVTREKTIEASARQTEVSPL